jgi:MFS family permease
VAKAYAILVVPFSLVGPLTGVFIDRWSRRRILAFTPLIRAAATFALVPFSGTGWPLYAAALVVVSLNRFFLSTASAVMPGLVPEPYLLVGNSMSSVGGTVATFVGIVAGTKLAGPLGEPGLLALTGAIYPCSALLAARIRRPMRPARPDASILEHASRVATELRSGARRLVATPAALGSIVTVLSVVVFKERFRETVASYGNLLAAGGAGVLAGTLTVGWLESRISKVGIVTVAFLAAGVVSLAVAPAIVGLTILGLSFVLGLTFAWRKIPVDTIVQEAVPDRFRGRVFAVYDILYSGSRVLAALAAVVLVPHVSTGWLVAGVGLVYLLWTPVLPRWVRRPRWAAIGFHEGSRAEEVPRTLDVAGERVRVEVLRSTLEERDGVRLRRYRLRTTDGEVLDVAEAPAVGGPGSASGSRWRIERDVTPPSVPNAPANSRRT